MAVLSTHALNAVDGTHAGAVGVVLLRLDNAGGRHVVFESATDEGGRLSQAVTVEETGAEYELVFRTGPYFAALGMKPTRYQIINDVVIRFRMPDPEGRYHIPLILSPNGYSVWWSGS